MAAKTISDGLITNNYLARKFYFIVAGLAGLYGVKTTLIKCIMSMAPSRDVLAQAQAEVALGNIPVGKVQIIKWRGKPVFIYHRQDKLTKTKFRDFL